MTSVSAPVPVTALLDRDGRILSADAALLRLQEEVGGDPQGSLAMPALAALVRLALRLKVPLSRAVELAMDDRDISLWVQLRPEGDAIHLAIVDWREQEPRGRPPVLRAVTDWEAGPGWLWQVDEHMRFRASEADSAALGHGAPETAEPFTSYFVLEDALVDGRTAMPMIEAVSARTSFSYQFAHLRSDPSARYRISGTAMYDRSGAYMGYRGRAARINGEASAAPAVAAKEPMPPRPMDNAADARGSELFGPALGRRLDQALRQPIGRIIANAGTIGERLEGPLRQDYANYAADIAAAGRHLLGLVDDLADLQAIERADFSPMIEEVDLADVARRAAGLLTIRAEARLVRIQTPATDEHVIAKAEYRRVLQILVNLIGNAVRHSPAESTIWVRVDEESDRAKVVVADQGNGIDPVDHARVFERFERLGNLDGEGSGLGLYISRKLARAMQGDVVIDSDLGRGARFTLDLPSWQASRTGTRFG
jgi:signal transduction histidine kinase